jgi:hypothetical protein
LRSPRSASAAFGQPDIPWLTVYALLSPVTNIEQFLAVSTVMSYSTAGGASLTNAQTGFG